MKMDSTGSTPYSIDDAEKLLGRLLGRRPRPWARIAEALLDVKRTTLWQGQAASFTDWLEAEAQKLNVPLAELWEFVSVSESYERLRGSTELPPACDIEAALPLELMAWLDRISRVAQPDVTRQFLQETLRGRHTRDSLQQIWLSYKQVLPQGHSGGRLRPVPTRPAGPARHTGIITALELQADAWAGIGRYRQFEEVALDPGGPPVDVVASLVPPEGDVLFFGVHIPPAPDACDAAGITALAPCFDRQWIVAEPEWMPKLAAVVPRSAGLLLWRQNEIRLLRRAAPRKGRDQTGRTAKALYARLC